MYYFEDLVDSIVQQQLSIKAAATIFERLKTAVADGDDSTKSQKHRWRKRRTRNIKLTPEKILAIKDTKLRESGLSNAKVGYVKDLAERVSSDKLQVTSLSKLSDEEVIRELVAVKGIGRWTAEMFLMFTLARPDIFPVDDLGLRNAFKDLIGEMESKEVEKFALRWKPYRTIASWYIWRSLEI
jgi:DNA-3-methyladenine glycosylase II